MSRRSTLVGLSVICVLLGTASADRAAEDFLRLVPERAWGLVVLNRPAVVNTKLLALARQIVQMPVPDPLAMSRQQFGAGWDEAGTIVLLLLPPEGGGSAPMTLVALIPVTDYGRFVKQFGAEDAKQPVTKIEIAHTARWARNIGGYAAVTDATHREFLEKTLTLSKAVPAALAPWRKWMAERDLAAVILPPGIKEVSARAQQGIQRLKSVAATRADVERAKAVAGALDLCAKLCQAAQREIAACGFGLQLNHNDAVCVTSRSLLVSGGAWARLAAQYPPSRENLLTGLPAEPFVAAGGGMLLGDAMDAVIAGLIRFSRVDWAMSAEQAEKLSAACLMEQSWKQARGFSAMLAAPKAGVPIFANCVTVARVEHSPAFMAAYQKDVQAYAAQCKEINNQWCPPPEIKNSAGGAGVKLTTSYSATPARSMGHFLGADRKFLEWVTPADERHIVDGYSENLVWSAAATVGGSQPGLAADPAIAKTAAALPPGAAAVVYVSPAGTAELYQQLVPAADTSPKPAKLPEFPQTPPIGFAVTTATDEVQTCLVVPTEVLRAAFAYAAQVAAISVEPAPAH